MSAELKAELKKRGNAKIALISPSYLLQPTLAQLALYNLQLLGNA
jgi:hypothetical protein